MYKRPSEVVKDDAYCRVFVVPDKYQGAFFKGGCLVTFLMLEQFELNLVDVDYGWESLDQRLLAYTKTQRWYDWQETYLILTGWGRCFTTTGIRSEGDIKLRIFLDEERLVKDL